MARPLTIWLLVLLAGGVLTNCTSSQSTPTPTPTPTQVLDVQEPNPGENAPATIPILQVEWQKLGPGGDHQVWPAYDRENPNILYLGQYGTGFWRSEDGGQTWEFIGKTLPTTLATTGTDYPLSQEELDRLDATLRADVIPHMEGYKEGTESYSGLTPYWAFRDEVILAPIIWMTPEDANQASPNTTIRLLLSPDKGKSWVELSALPVPNMFGEVYTTLVLTTPKSIKLYIGSLNGGTLWYREVPHEAVAGLVP